MSSASVSAIVFEDGPTFEMIEDSSSVWFVPVEFRADYLEAVRGIGRKRSSEIASLVVAGISGNKTITSSWLLGLRSEARQAAGLSVIPAERPLPLREGWPSALSGVDGVTAWAIHQSAVEEAVQAVIARQRAADLESSCAAVCQACEVRVSSVRAGLCDSCSSVLEVARLRRAEELGRQRLEGRRSRLEAVEGWLDRQ